VKITPQQLDAWKKAVEPINQQWIEAANKVGVNGQQALASLRQELKSRGAGQ